MQVHCDEGVAIRIGPEPCVGVREDAGEASAGERAGQPAPSSAEIQGTALPLEMNHAPGLPPAWQLTFGGDFFSKAMAATIWRCRCAS